MDTRTLTHWGIKGQKWGVRRYQNPDGTYTAAGKKRRNQEDTHEDYTKAHDKKNVKSMSDKELRERINRLQMEQQYANLTQKRSKGKEIASAVLTEVAKETAKNTIGSLLKGEQPAIMKGYKKVEGLFKSEGFKKNVAAVALAGQINLGARKLS